MPPENKDINVLRALQSIVIDFERLYSPKRRALCHVLFWLSLMGVYIADLSLINTEFTLSMTFVIVFRQISQSVLLFYFVSYFVIPKLFLRQRYLIGVLAFSFPFLMATTIDFLTFKLFYPLLLKGTVAENYIEFGLFARDPGQIIDRQQMILSIMPVLLRTLPAFIMKLLVSIIHFFSDAIRQRKKHHDLEMENLQLEVNFLKAQMNPHYLFNTLNHIYTYTYLKDDRALDLISDLSEVLSYTLYESKDTFVALEKELTFIEHYLNLEKVRLGDHEASLQVDIRKDGAELMKIAPLLLFPLVENAFKHGIEADKKSGWLDLKISITGDTLIFDLKNSKGKHGTLQVAPDGKIIGGVGISATRRRLELLYPSKHGFSIADMEDTYAVHLTIKCQTHERKAKLHYS